MVAAIGLISNVELVPKNYVIVATAAMVLPQVLDVSEEIVFFAIFACVVVNKIKDLIVSIVVFACGIFILVVFVLVLILVFVVFIIFIFVLFRRIYNYIIIVLRTK